MRRDRKNPLHSTCSALVSSCPARGQTPYLVAWIEAPHSLPEYAWMELAQIVIDSLTQQVKAAAKELSADRRDIAQRRAESMLLRLESVLARAAGRTVQDLSAASRRTSQRLRDQGLRRRTP